MGDIPKTRNAKVMRRVIRAAYLGESPGDLSALVNPEAVEEIRRQLDRRSGNGLSEDFAQKLGLRAWIRQTSTRLGTESMVQGKLERFCMVTRSCFFARSSSPTRSLARAGGEQLGLATPRRSASGRGCLALPPARHPRRYHRTPGRLARATDEHATGQYGITPLEMTTAQEAADEIARLAGPSRRVLVNRSATVAELRPCLEAHGLEVVETYDGQFSHPAQGVERYWQLDSPSAETAWRAFHPQTIKPSSPQSTDIAVLGVNVIAADDGTVFFVQHLFNISEMLEQASQVVLV